MRVPVTPAARPRPSAVGRRVRSASWRGALAALAAAILIAGFIALAAALADDGTSLVFAQIIPRGGSGAPDGPTIQAVGYGRASAPADAARLQILVVPFEGGPGGPIGSGPTPDATPGAEELAAAAPLVEALVAAGVPREAIRVVVSPALRSGYYGPGGGETFRLDVALDAAGLGQLEATLNAVNAATGGGQSLANIGLAYSLADCAAVERQAREAAVADARARAAQQADLLGAELGALRTVEDGPTPPSGASVCGSPSADQAAFDPFAPPGISLPALDPGAPAEVTVAVEVRATFAIPSLES